MFTIKHGVARALGAAALGAAGLVASTALASAPGSTVDSSGCEHHSGSAAPNWCNTGSGGIHITANGDNTNAGYYVANQNGTSAYAVAKCTDGIDAVKGEIYQTGEYQCTVGQVGEVSICGTSPACANELP